MEKEHDFIEREFQDFSPGLGDLPDDLRSSGPITIPDGSFIPPIEGDSYATVASGIMGGASRPFVEPIPSGFANQITFQAINYLPRANFESFRAQRFFAGGTALLPPNPTAFVDLCVNPATLLPTSPVKFSTGVITVPQGYAAIITGVRQWVGDATAVQKPDGTPDDIFWRVSTGGTAIFDFGNFPFLVSSMPDEGHMFVVANESTTFQISAKNNLSPSDIFARSISVQAVLTGHWFPVDELNDIFRNR